MSSLQMGYCYVRTSFSHPPNRSPRHPFQNFSVHDPTVLANSCLKSQICGNLHFKDSKLVKVVVLQPKVLVEFQFQEYQIGQKSVKTPN